MIQIRRIVAGILDNLCVLGILIILQIKIFFLIVSIESTVLPLIAIAMGAFIIFPILAGFVFPFFFLCQVLYYILESVYYYICYLTFNGSLGQLCMGLMVVDSDGKKLSNKQKWVRSNGKVLLRYAYYIPLIFCLIKGDTLLWYDKKIGSRVIFRSEYKNKENGYSR